MGMNPLKDFFGSVVTLLTNLKNAKDMPRKGPPRPGLIILKGVICTLVGAVLWLFSDTLFSNETILFYVGFGSISLFLAGLVATVVGVIQALIGIIKALIVTIRGWIIDDATE